MCPMENKYKDEIDINKIYKEMIDQVRQKEPSPLSQSHKYRLINIDKFYIKSYIKFTKLL